MRKAPAKAKTVQKKVTPVKEDEPESDYGNSENLDKDVLKKKEGLMLEILQSLSSIEA